jgi:hypothetical protein
MHQLIANNGQLMHMLMPVDKIRRASARLVSLRDDPGTDLF